MDRNRILELALEGLQKQKEGIDQEIEMVRAELKGGGSTVREAKVAAAIPTGRRSRTPAERRAQAERMRQYWAAKRGNAAKVAKVPKSQAGAGAKLRTKTAAQKKALSLKMKEIWKKRKAAAAKKKK